jgi:MoxR-like ATPase
MYDEKKILDEMEHDKDIQINKIIGHKEFFELKDAIQDVKLSDHVKQYITKLMDATRNSAQLLYGASPRGSIGIMVASKALAFCEGRNYVSHEDVQRVALAVLRHRVILSYEAKTDGLDADDVLVEIFGKVSLT